MTSSRAIDATKVNLVLILFKLADRHHLKLINNIVQHKSDKLTALVAQVLHTRRNPNSRPLAYALWLARANTTSFVFPSHYIMRFLTECSVCLLLFAHDEVRSISVFPSAVVPAPVGRFRVTMASGVAAATDVCSPCEMAIMEIAATLSATVYCGPQRVHLTSIRMRKNVEEMEWELRKGLQDDMTARNGASPFGTEFQQWASSFRYHRAFEYFGQPARLYDTETDMRATWSVNLQWAGKSLQKRGEAEVPLSSPDVERRKK